MCSCSNMGRNFLSAQPHTGDYSTSGKSFSIRSTSQIRNHLLWPLAFSRHLKITVRVHHFSFSSRNFEFHQDVMRCPVLCCAVFVCSLFSCKNMFFWQKNKFALVKSQVCLGNYAIQFCAPILSLFFANIFKGLSTFQIANIVEAHQPIPITF